MIEGVRDVSEFLYHYTKGSTALSRILANRTIRLGSYVDTNDPKETKSWHFQFGTNENRDLGRYRYAELSRWLTDELKRKTKLVCFSMDTQPLTGDHVRDIFNRGFSKPRMWAQYAERHAGVCLVFDRAKLAEKFKEQLSAYHLVISGPVRYVNRSVIPDLLTDNEYTINIDVLETHGQEAYVQRHLRTFYQRLFFEKMTDWRDETEWRWVVFAPTAEELHIKFEDSLVGLMFGEDSPDAVINSAMAMTKAWGLRYCGLKWKNHSPWYDYLRYMPKPWGGIAEGDSKG
jgi:hypothetical protein